MARLPRLTVPGYPHHVIQRGNNRQLIFTAQADYELLLSLLAENARKFEVALHGYVLMTNHFHLLATPSTVDGVSRLMQAVGRSYVRRFNREHGRSGTLWEGRYRSTLIQADRYFMACMAYMDLNPVRAGMVATPRDYPWSSHAHHVGLRSHPMITTHPLYWELGNTPFAREVAYGEMVAAGLPERIKQALTTAVHSGWPLGEPDFVKNLQARTARRVAKGHAGRPPLSQAG